MTPPVPLLAEWSEPETLQVWFDQALVPGGLDPVNWHARYAGSQWDAYAADAAGSVVTLNMIELGPDGDPQTCKYDASPADVIALATGLPAAAFAGFPIP